MIALVDFVAVVGGKEVQFRKGDKISAAVAKDLKLSEKPHLAGVASEA